MNGCTTVRRTVEDGVVQYEIEDREKRRIYVYCVPATWKTRYAFEGMLEDAQLHARRRLSDGEWGLLRQWAREEDKEDLLRLLEEIMCTTGA